MGQFHKTCLDHGRVTFHKKSNIIYVIEIQCKNINIYNKTSNNNINNIFFSRKCMSIFKKRKKNCTTNAAIKKK